MKPWIAFTAWFLSIGGSAGIIYSLLKLDFVSLLINGVLLAIGLHDLHRLKHLDKNPVYWQWLAGTQILLGILIGLSMASFGLNVLDSEIWKEATRRAAEILGNPHGIEYEFQRMVPIMKWGMIIGGALVFLSQVWIGIGLLQKAKSTTPPKLPGQN